MNLFANTSSLRSRPSLTPGGRSNLAFRDCFVRPLSCRIFFVMTVTLLMTMLLATRATANDVNVYDVTEQNYNSGTSPKTLDIKFSISQKNAFSGTDANSAAYYDRVWVFVKWFRSDWPADTAWRHATLVTGGTVGAYSGGSVGVGLAGNNSGNASPYLGAFVKAMANQTVRWAVETDDQTAVGSPTTFDASKIYKVRVFAIEMVLIPTGNFALGNSDNESGSFRDGATATALQITSTSQTNGLTLGGTTAGNLANNNNASTYDDFNNTTTQSLPATFPMGYNAFYIMKYDIAQKDYCNFLNTLTVKQASYRVETNHFNANRNYILKSSDTPARYGCYASVPTATWGTVPIASMNGPSDGQWIACNWLEWQDVCAYADWAGLRPMTEMEYEKACRGGGVAAVAGDYAWGSTAAYNSTAYTLSNAGAINESIATNYSNTLGNINDSQTWNLGPMRCGIFSLPTNSGSAGKIASGASYYGVMDLSGNLWKRCVTVGNGTSGTVIGGRAFQGTHGDGYLINTNGSYDGNATNADWPGYDTSVSTRGITAATGSGFRGGSWFGPWTYARVSDRSNAANTDAYRGRHYGGRGARTSPSP